MRAAFLILTTLCNSNCAFCFYQQKPDWHKQYSMSYQEFIKTLSTLKLLGLSYLYLSGGEPTTINYIEQAIELASQNEVKTILLSNGLNADAKRIKFLKSKGLNSFVLNLNQWWDYGPSSELNNLVYLFKSTFQDDASGIFVFTKSNYKTLPELVKWSDRVGFEMLIQPAYIPESSPDKAALCPYELPDEAWELMDKTGGEYLRARGLGRYWELIKSLRKPSQIEDLPLYCPMGLDACVIDSDGTVYPCFHRRDLACGNILSDSQIEIAQKLERTGIEISDAHCFGRHCASLFTHHV